MTRRQEMQTTEKFTSNTASDVMIVENMFSTFSEHQQCTGQVSTALVNELKGWSMWRP